MPITPQSVLFYELDKIENRRYQRVKVDLTGRYMLSNRQEYPRHTLNMSPGGLSIIAEKKGQIGEDVIIYLQEIGRLETKIVRITEEGFALSIEATETKRIKLAEQLTWLTNRNEMGTANLRGSKRAIPQKPHATLTLKDGNKVPVIVDNISYSGAAIKTKIVPNVDEIVSLNGQLARVARHMENGCGLEFSENARTSIIRLASELGAEI